MKKILISLIVLILFSGCIINSKEPIEYEIEELSTLIENTYKEVYGFQIKVENICNPEYSNKNSKSTIGYLYEFSLIIHYIILPSPFYFIQGLELTNY